MLQRYMLMFIGKRVIVLHPNERPIHKHINVNLYANKPVVKKIIWMSL